MTKDIPSNVIAVGNPCKVLREITDEDKTDYLERMDFLHRNSEKDFNSK